MIFNDINDNKNVSIKYDMKQKVWNLYDEKQIYSPKQPVSSILILEQIDIITV